MMNEKEARRYFENNVLRQKVCVSCCNEEDSMKFMQFVEECGILWVDGEAPTEYNAWALKKITTVIYYTFTSGRHRDCMQFVRHPYSDYGSVPVSHFIDHIPVKEPELDMLKEVYSIEI